MESNIVPRMGPGRRTWSVLIGAVVLLAGTAVWRSARTAGSMSAAGTSDEKKFEDAVAGSKAKIVIEIEETTRQGMIQGRLLEKKTEEIYTRTLTTVKVSSNASTKVVMGKQADIHQGAVVHVTGNVQEDRSVAAKQIVILTGYVKAQ